MCRLMANQRLVRRADLRQADGRYDGMAMRPLPRVRRRSPGRLLMRAVEMVSFCRAPLTP